MLTRGREQVQEHVAMPNLQDLQGRVPALITGLVCCRIYLHKDFKFCAGQRKQTFCVVSPAFVLSFGYHEDGSFDM